MNALVKMDSKPINSPTPARSLSQRQIADQLARERWLCRPFEYWDTLETETPLWWQSVLDCPSSDDIIAPRSERERAYRINEVRGALSKLPDQERLHELNTILTETAEAFDEPKARFLVSFMIDGFPNARPHNPAMYYEAAVFELGRSGYSPSVIAAACIDIRRTATFLPTVADILARCDGFRTKAEIKRSICAKALKAGPRWARELETLERSGTREAC